MKNQSVLVFFSSILCPAQVFNYLGAVSLCCFFLCFSVAIFYTISACRHGVHTHTFADYTAVDRREPAIGRVFKLMVNSIDVNWWLLHRNSRATHTASGRCNFINNISLLCALFSSSIRCCEPHTFFLLFYRRVVVSFRFRLFPLAFFAVSSLDLL